MNPPSPLHNNQLLASACLDAPALHYLEPELINLQRDERLPFFVDHAGHAYFPDSAILSVRCVLEDGATSEIACVGNEGALGAPPFGGCLLQPHIVTVNAGGSAYRIRSEALRGLAAGPLRSVLERSALTLAVQLVQNAACSSHHTVEQRVAKWLLLSLRRSGCHVVPTTHETLASVLGVRRESISQIVKRLTWHGTITHSRSNIEVLSSALLAQHACECYRLACASLAAQTHDLADIRRSAEATPNAHVPMQRQLSERRRASDSRQFQSRTGQQATALS